MSAAIALVLLGVAALYGGPKLLAVIIPIGMLIWYGTGTMLPSGRD